MRLPIFYILLLIIFTNLLPAQTIFISPYFGFAQVKMDAVNNDLDFRMDNFRRQYRINAPQPPHFNGNYAWGIQANYHFEEDYFLNVKSFYFREKNTADQSFIPADSYVFQFDREIELFEVSIGINYFFNYSSWKRLNTYFGSNVGYAAGWSKSSFIYRDLSENNPAEDNYSDFSSDAMTAHFSAGVLLRIAPFMHLQGEAGYRFANLQEMSGHLRTLESDNSNYSTTAKYDFSGFYIFLATTFIIPI